MGRGRGWGQKSYTREFALIKARQSSLINEVTNCLSPRRPGAAGSAKTRTAKASSFTKGGVFCRPPRRASVVKLTSGMARCGGENGVAARYKHDILLIYLLAAGNESALRASNEKPREGEKETATDVEEEIRAKGSAQPAAFVGWFSGCLPRPNTSHSHFSTFCIEKL